MSQQCKANKHTHPFAEQGAWSLKLFPRVFLFHNILHLVTGSQVSTLAKAEGDVHVTVLNRLIT